MRRTAVGRLVNFLTGWRSSKGTTPAKLFQTSIMLVPGQSVASLVSYFSVAKSCWGSALTGTPACAMMLFSESMVNVAIGAGLLF
jgi:hypothetical protein